MFPFYVHYSKYQKVIYVHSSSVCGKYIIHEIPIRWLEMPIPQKTFPDPEVLVFILFAAGLVELNSRSRIAVTLKSESMVTSFRRPDGSWSDRHGFFFHFSWLKASYKGFDGIWMIWAAKNSLITTMGSTGSVLKTIRMILHVPGATVVMSSLFIGMDVTSALLHRRVLRGVCDGEVLLDSKLHISGKAGADGTNRSVLKLGEVTSTWKVCTWPCFGTTLETGRDHTSYRNIFKRDWRYWTIINVNFLTRCCFDTNYARPIGLSRKQMSLYQVIAFAVVSSPHVWKLHFSFCLVGGFPLLILSFYAHSTQGCSSTDPRPRFAPAPFFSGCLQCFGIGGLSGKQGDERWNQFDLSKSEVTQTKSKDRRLD